MAHHRLGEEGRELDGRRQESTAAEEERDNGGVCKETATWATDSDGGDQRWQGGKNCCKNGCGRGKATIAATDAVDKRQLGQQTRGDDGSKREAGNTAKKDKSCSGRNIREAAASGLWLTRERCTMGVMGCVDLLHTF